MRYMKKIRFKRRYFTLLETLIALALTSLALSSLFFFYREVVTLNNQADQLEKESFKLRHIENRLSFIFPRVISETSKHDFFFFTAKDPGGLYAPGNPTSLIFTFDQGVDLSKAFSNIILSQIFLDNQRRICLASWPAPSRWNKDSTLPMKFQVLLEEVDSLKFWFFIAPNKKWDPTPAAGNPTPPTPPANAAVTVKLNPSPEGGWIDYWNQEFHQLPAIVKMEIKRREKTEFFAFPLSNSQRQPVYNQ